MLVLSRKSGEGVRIGPGTSIVVLEVKGNRVRLGIQCPSGVRVLRDELLPAVNSLAEEEFAVS